MPRRVRHHTNDEGLEGIIRRGGITASRGWLSIEVGVHVEVEPFGTTRIFREGKPGPKNDTGCAGEGAYVEFDDPGGMVFYSCGPRNTAIIPLELGQPLVLKDLNPEFVKVRKAFWQFWRRKPE
jgi:hypothetical protein